MQRFVPFHRRQTVNGFEAITEHVLKVGLAHSLSSTEFTRLRATGQFCKNGRFVHLRCPPHPRSTMARNVFFLVEKAGLSSKCCRKNTASILRKTGFDVRSVETFLQKWGRKHNKSVPSDLLPTDPDGQNPGRTDPTFPENLGQRFPTFRKRFKKKYCAWWHSSAKKAKRKCLKFLNRVFTTTNLSPSFFNKQARPELVLALAKFPGAGLWLFFESHRMQDFQISVAYRSHYLATGGRRTQQSRSARLVFGRTHRTSLC